MELKLKLCYPIRGSGMFFLHLFKSALCYSDNQSNISMQLSCTVILTFILWFDAKLLRYKSRHYGIGEIRVFLMNTFGLGVLSFICKGHKYRKVQLRQATEDN